MTKFTLHIETEDAAVVERIGRAMQEPAGTVERRGAYVPGKVSWSDEDPRGDRFETDGRKVTTPFTSDGNPPPFPDAEQAFTRGVDPAPTATEKGENGTDTDTPAPAVTEPANTGQSVELDEDGLPWDERIHASTKTKKQDGRWKAKRGVNPDTVKQVEAELHAVMGHTELQAPEEDAPTPPPVAPPAPPAPEPVADSDAPTDFMGVVQAAGRHGWTPDQIGAALQKCNPPLPSFQQLANRPDLIPQFWAAIQGG